MSDKHQTAAWRKLAKPIRAAANADPDTRCWRCNRTLDQHEPHASGRRPHWQAGHVVDGITEAGLLPEASTCNSVAGALTAARRNVSGYSWP